MLSVNGRISHGVSRDDTMWLERPELNIGDAFNRQIRWKRKRWLKSRAVKQGGVTWDQCAEGWMGKCFWSKDRSLKSERKYQLVVRLKAIEYKEDCLCYLSSTSSLHLVVLLESFIIFLLVLMVRMCMMCRSTTPSRLLDALDLLPLAVTRMVVHGWSWRWRPEGLGQVSPVQIIRQDPFCRHFC